MLGLLTCNLFSEGMEQIHLLVKKVSGMGSQSIIRYNNNEYCCYIEFYLTNVLTSQEDRAMVENYASVVHTVVD